MSVLIARESHKRDNQCLIQNPRILELEGNSVNIYSNLNFTYEETEAKGIKYLAQGHVPLKQKISCLILSSAYFMIHDSPHSN